MQNAAEPEQMRVIQWTACAKTLSRRLRNSDAGLIYPKKKYSYLCLETRSSAVEAFIMTLSE